MPPRYQVRLSWSTTQTTSLCCCRSLEGRSCSRNCVFAWHQLTSSQGSCGTPTPVKAVGCAKHQPPPLTYPVGFQASAVLIRNLVFRAANLIPRSLMPPAAAQLEAAVVAFELLGWKDLKGGTTALAAVLCRCLRVLAGAVATLQASI